MTVINKRYNYIFVHIPKTAGKSIKQHLITTTFDGQERRKLKIGVALEAIGSYANSNKITEKIIPNPLGYGTDDRLTAYCLERRIFTSAHLRSYEICEALGADEYRSMFSFAFVRNPGDRCLSAYFYFKRKRLHPLHGVASQLSFEEFLVRQNDIGMPFIGQQVGWIYSVRGEKMVDFIGKVENIETDMAVVGERIGWKADTFHTHTNQSKARSQGYRSYYSELAREVVSNAMRSDIELLDYSF